MVPVYHRPVISYAFDHLHSLPDLNAVVVNTHHCPEAYAAAFPENRYRDFPLHFRHEPVLLETAGGIANVADLLDGDRFIVYNGDVLADVPLAPLLKTHEAAGNEVTLLLRSSGPGLHIGLDPETGRVRDIRNMLESNIEPLYQFTGIYLVEPAFLRRLTPGKKESVIPIFLKMIREQASLGGWIEDRGHWWDLGDEVTYRQVHRHIPSTRFPEYIPGQKKVWPRILPSADIASSARVAEDVVAGPGARIEAGAVVEDAILWPGAHVPEGCRVSGQVLRGERHWHYQHFFPVPTDFEKA